jgi:hypothetical protein
MNANSGSPSMAGTIIKIVFIILSLYALYYLYKYLFASSGLKGDLVVGNITDANTGGTGASGSPYKPILVTGDKFPVLLEGGEYSVNMWVYINDWSVRHGSNKHILTLGGVTGTADPSNFATLLVYLGGNKNTLSVRVDTKDRSGNGGNGGNGDSANSLSGSINAPVSLTEAEITTKMTSTPSSLDGADVCDLDNIDLQKWVLLSIVLNNKTCDVYMDGKLARSCILPSFFRVNKPIGSNARFCDYGGFGGFISNVSFYNYALNPEQVWRYYMSGPIPEYSLMDYLKGLFTPDAISYDYPKNPAGTP